MKKPQPRGPNGKFVVKHDPDRVAKLNHDEVVTKRRLARRGLDLDSALFGSDRKIAAAVRRETEAFLAELGSDVLTPSASALVSSIVLTRVRRDTMAAFIVELGPRAFNRARREAYKIVAQLNDLERLLADLLKQFNELKFTQDLEKRIEALEDARLVPRATAGVF